jgi:hypothetical protein
MVAAVSYASILGIDATRGASIPSKRSAQCLSCVYSAASLVSVPGATAIGHALGWLAAFWMLAGQPFRDPHLFGQQGGPER